MNERFRLALAIVILIGVVGSAWVFWGRGPAFALSHSADFILVYAPARALLTGANAYDMTQNDQVWAEAGGPYELRPSIREDGALIYPLTTLVMFAPFAVLPWAIALPAWVFANLFFLGVTIWWIARLAGFRAAQRRMWLFVIAVLLFTPLHTSFRVGQTPVFVMTLIAVGFAVGARPFLNRQSSIGNRLRGVLLACASLIKPQIGLPFLALEALRRRWATVFAAVVVMAIVALVAVLPITLRGVPWWSNWQTNLANFTHNSVGDPTAINPVRHQLLNLHYPLHGFIEDRATVKLLVFLIVGGMAAWFFRFWILDLGFRVFKRQPSPEIQNRKSNIQNSDLLLPLSMVAVLALMVVYHRYYDAVLLFFPLAWAIRALAERRRDRIGWGVLILMLPFYANAATALTMLEQRAALPSALLDSWWWDNLIKAQQAWALPIMAVLLVVAGERQRATITES